MIWIIGASSGLGKGAFDALYRAGHTLVGTSRSFERTEGERRLLLPLDVTRQASVDRFIRDAVEAFGVPDVVLYGAGLLHLAPVEQLTGDMAGAVMDVCYTGCARLMSGILPRMKARGSGHLILLCSINAHVATPYQAAYTAAKHALLGYGKALAMELAPTRLAVTVLSPGDHRGGSDSTRLKADTGDAAFDRITKKMRQDELTGRTPESFGQAVARIVNKKRPPIHRYIADPLQYLAVPLYRLLPKRLYHRLMRLYYR